MSPATMTVSNMLIRLTLCSLRWPNTVIWGISSKNSWYFNLHSSCFLSAHQAPQSFFSCQDYCSWKLCNLREKEMSCITSWLRQIAWATQFLGVQTWACPPKTVEGFLSASACCCLLPTFGTGVYSVKRWSETHVGISISFDTLYT